jgi:hypothetical protein
MIPTTKRGPPQYCRLHRALRPGSERVFAVEADARQIDAAEGSMIRIRSELVTGGSTTRVPPVLSFERSLCEARCRTWMRPSSSKRREMPKTSTALYQCLARIEAMETTGARLRRASMSGSACSPVRPGGMLSCQPFAAGRECHRGNFPRAGVNPETLGPS